jgi:hypothetical protein
MNKLQIRTPKGGEPIYYLILTKDDDFIGNVKFRDYESFIKFKNAYSSLPVGEWGTIQLDFDV